MDVVCANADGLLIANLEAWKRLYRRALSADDRRWTIDHEKPTIVHRLWSIVVKHEKYFPPAMRTLSLKESLLRT